MRYRSYDRPVKITVPGPATIVDTCANAHYSKGRELAMKKLTAICEAARAV